MTTNGRQASEDYRRIERAIRFLDEHTDRQPGLEAVADHLRLSPSHTQRLFSRWAGISPKRFLQVLTTEHAKRLLAKSRDVLSVTHETGLSSTSRLHDHLVTCEAVTPGEFKRRGEGLEIAHGFHSSPFGECRVAVTDRGVCGLAFVQGGDRDAALRELRRRYERALWRHEPERIDTVAERIFASWRPEAGDDDRRPLHLLLAGTNFQIRVWEALLRIPPGLVVSYGDLAEHLGDPRASRAVGGAVGANPIPYLIPCHRVIRSSGAFGNYGGGVVRKKALLAREQGTRVH